MFFFAYGALCYVIFLATFLYLIGFVEDWVVPKSVNDGADIYWIRAVTVDIPLMACFGIQHSIMARPGFKKWWTRVVPVQIERSTFVLATCLVLALIFWQWQPIKTVAWEIDINAVRYVLTAISVGGWLLVLYSTFLIDHFDLFGLRQVWFHLRGAEYHHPPFAMPFLYRLVRNPLMLGFIVAMWSCPTMTYGRLIFAGGMTACILIGVQFEERDLLGMLGDDYRRYRERTPMLIPRPPKPETSSAE